ncbi:TPA: DUF3108 domain-containing protein [Neisseria meningitidis]|uniref:DUF3108 domain-containing protein n=5 Tax=Neisseria meningitidis TaxID=487 RepID=A0A1B1WXZ8_NEIME|nr:DUF3108 domain-containing protein [Neisseria meningitidis]EGC53359.1 hypothetical protein NMBOX9930304_0613 [Neisseria meningitidis OX99.30304]EGC65107.1 hypothetical protein NMB9615945_0693 [Neisseria meningitidis 961-5945]KER39291.1 hypothetical protein F528_1788 [Neisseria meningitidis 992008]ADY94131.1 conserved hypothetical protein [Neisseria meningitidis G2136]ADY97213.1 conserved hypothetical protein [Neisseria meningitidis M01-240149]
MMKTFKNIFSAAILSAALPCAYAAGLPQSAVLHYSGSYGIPATMTFERSGNAYKIVSTIKVPLYNIRFESGGTVVGNTLHPTYYRDIRRGKLYAEAKFADGSVTYGKAGESKTEQSPKAMDLFTLAWQLAANDAKLPPGLKITNGKKLYSVGGLNKAGTGKYSIGGVETEVVKYRVRRGDDTVMYFFAPSLNNIPAQIGYTDDGKTYTLKLKSVQINGQSAKP